VPPCRAPTGLPGYPGHPPSRDGARRAGGGRGDAPPHHTTEKPAAADGLQRRGLSGVHHPDAGVVSSGCGGHLGGLLDAHPCASDRRPGLGDRMAAGYRGSPSAVYPYCAVTKRSERICRLTSGPLSKYRIPPSRRCRRIMPDEHPCAADANTAAQNAANLPGNVFGWNRSASLGSDQRRPRLSTSASPRSRIIAKTRLRKRSVST